MKIIAIADLHENVDLSLPACDLLLIGGDVLLGPNREYQEQVLKYTIEPWLKQQRHQGVKEIVVCAGNHDFVFEDHPEWVPEMSWTYLQDEGVTINGIKIWGSPWQRPFFDWAFNLEERELKKKWGMIPDDVDILLTHSPPFGYGDKVRNESAGSTTLRDRVEKIKPKLHVFGHIHVGRGIYHNDTTIFANAALVDSSYTIKYRPYHFEWIDGEIRHIDLEDWD